MATTPKRSDPSVDEKRNYEDTAGLEGVPPPFTFGWFPPPIVILTVWLFIVGLCLLRIWATPPDQRLSMSRRIESVANEKDTNIRDNAALGELMLKRKLAEMTERDNQRIAAANREREQTETKGIESIPPVIPKAESPIEPTPPPTPSPPEPSHDLRNEKDISLQPEPINNRACRIRISPSARSSPVVPTIEFGQGHCILGERSREIETASAVTSGVAGPLSITLDRKKTLNSYLFGRWKLSGKKPDGSPLEISGGFKIRPTDTGANGQLFEEKDEVIVDEMNVKVSWTDK